jgi:hypothetical protein
MVQATDPELVCCNHRRSSVVRDVRELRADLARVDPIEIIQNLAQRRTLRHRPTRLPVDELRIEIGFAETEVFERENSRTLATHQTQRIEIGDQVAAVGKDLDETRDRALLGPRRRLADRLAAPRARDARGARGRRSLS